MEKKIIEGKFKPNVGGTAYLVVLALILSAFLIWIVSEDAILEVGTFTVTLCILLIFLCIYGAYVCYVTKDQRLIVTNLRVHGEVRKKAINLPLDMIAHIDISGSNLTITTLSGAIKCKCCTNADAVYAAILNLLNERRYSSKVRADTSDRNAYIAEELNVYKKLLDENLITQEEYEAKKKKLLGL